MGFKTDGSVHTNGIANEVNTIAVLNRLGIYSDTVEHRGGTQQKADAVAGSIGISIKEKMKGIGVGSFDWCNTTKMPMSLSSKFDTFKSIVSELRTLSEAERRAEVEMVRSAFNNVSANAFDTFETADLVSFLRSTFAKQAGYDIVITDGKAKKLYHFSADEHPVVKMLADGFTPVLAQPRKAGQTSRSIYFIKDGNVTDSGLRLRITSNNGISAFLGLSKANKTSSVVLKLQQDNVSGLLESVNATSYAI